ncbi:hypothetical protein Syun_024389 [Stephania yunnanensis]|uniref:Uncharacterized protein n=1 Tax=Stephania yunnanensis TaxID=152371 RepID=A0AAP0I4B1_9MAGN
MMMEVEIITRDTIKPSSPTPSHLKTYNLSYFDQLTPQIFVPILLYYNYTKSTTSTSSSTCLKESLSKCLTKFYPLAGRLKDGIFVDCNDAGVDYLEAKVKNCSLLDVVANPKIDSLKQLLPVEPQTLESESGSESPLLVVQVNQFQCGGLVIGMWILHKVADASSLSSFINGWSSTNRGDNVAVAPHFELATLFPGRKIEGYQVTEGVGEEKIATKRFVFNASAIATLKDGARKGSSVESPTRVEVVSAFMWKRFIESNRSKSHPTRKDYMAFHTVNLRKRRDPPLAEHGFGNMCIGANALVAAENDVDDLNSLIGKIRVAIRGLDGEFVKKVESGDEEYLNHIMAEIMKACEGEGEKEQIDFSSWCRLGLYDADFGWGKPVWVSPTLNLKNFVILMDTRSGDGIEAWVNMLEEDLVGLENDPELLSFTSETTI